jgi:hypothetical protein
VLQGEDHHEARLLLQLLTASCMHATMESNLILPVIGSHRTLQSTHGQAAEARRASPRTAHDVRTEISQHALAWLGLRALSVGPSHLTLSLVVPPIPVNPT